MGGGERGLFESAWISNRLFSNLRDRSPLSFATVTGIVEGRYKTLLTLQRSALSTCPSTLPITPVCLCPLNNSNVVSQENGKGKISKKKEEGKWKKRGRKEMAVLIPVRQWRASILSCQVIDKNAFVLAVHASCAVICCLMSNVRCQ